MSRHLMAKMRTAGWSYLLAQDYRDEPISTPHLMMPIEEALHYAVDHSLGRMSEMHGPLTKHNLPRPESRPEALADIQESGVIKRPILLHVHGDEAQLDDGHHRLSIADHLGMTHIPVWVHHVTGDEEDFDEQWRPQYAKPIQRHLREYLRGLA